MSTYEPRLHAAKRFYAEALNERNRIRALAGLAPRPEDMPSNNSGDRANDRRRKEPMKNLLRELYHSIRGLLRGERPPLPKCEYCGDEMMLVLEVEEGKCTDCMDPAYLRRCDDVSALAKIGMTPRAFGKGSKR
jgi:hypothetical protein